MEKMTINNKFISSNKSPYYLGFLFVIIYTTVNIDKKP